MIPQKLFDEISQKIQDIMANSPARDIEKNIRAMLGSSLSQFELVSREEFDLQSEILARTRDTLIQLEQRIAELERKNQHS